MIFEPPPGLEYVHQCFEYIQSRNKSSYYDVPLVVYTVGNNGVPLGQVFDTLYRTNPYSHASTYRILYNQSVLYIWGTGR